MDVLAVILLVIGVIALIASLVLPKAGAYDGIGARGVARVVAVIGILIGIVLGFLSTMYTQDEGEAKVLRSFTGEIVGSDPLPFDRLAIGTRLGETLGMKPKAVRERVETQLKAQPFVSAEHVARVRRRLIAQVATRCAPEAFSASAERLEVRAHRWRTTMARVGNGRPRVDSCHRRGVR